MLDEIRGLLGQPVQEDGFVSVEVLLTEIAAAIERNNVSIEQKKCLEVLCHKIDVAKTIYTYYTIEYLKPANAKVLDVKYIYLLTYIYLSLAWDQRDFKYLNTACKCLDFNDCKSVDPVIYEKLFKLSDKVLDRLFR